MLCLMRRGMAAMLRLQMMRRPGSSGAERLWSGTWFQRYQMLGKRRPEIPLLRLRRRGSRSNHCLEPADAGTGPYG